MGAVLSKDEIARGFAGGSLTYGMECLEKRDKRRGFRWAQVLSVCWHVAASLDHLADELVLREPHGNAVERRTPLSAEFTKRMAIAALLHLKYESSLSLKRRCAVQQSFWHRITAPGVHMRTPRSKSGEMCKCP
jgi:hypothetical protein